MKKLLPETFLGYELHTYEYYPNGKRHVIGYAYKENKSLHKEDFEFEASSNNKRNVLTKLRNQISKIKPKPSLQEVRQNMLKKYSNILYEKNGKIYMHQPEEFYWLKKQIKCNYNKKIKFINDEVIL